MGANEGLPDAVPLKAVVARLGANSTVVTALTTDVGDEQARWKPEPAKWSILEVVNHLADEEIEDFRTRVDFTLHRPGEPWPSIDPQGWAIERSYNDRSLPKSVDRFVTRRAESIAFLQGLREPDWSAAYEHPQLGRIEAGDLLTSWLAHDHIHIRQLNRLHRQYLVERVSPYSPDYAGRW